MVSSIKVLLSAALLFGLSNGIFWDSALSDYHICKYGSDSSDSNKYGVTYLSNSDFEDGTLRIMKPGIYALTEDIIHRPRADLDNPNDLESYFVINEEDEFPGSSQDVASGPFKLGFFAGISVEASDVWINLCGYSISMGLDFYLQQRFYVSIVIGSQIVFEDEGAFSGGPLTPQSEVKISNGELGLSSHWGIFGLEPENILICDIKIHKFEVLVIHFNGFNNIIIRNVEVGPTSTIVPTNGLYSQARFLLNGFSKLVERLPNQKIQFFDREYPVTLSDIQDELIEQLDLFFKWYLGKISIKSLHPEEKKTLLAAIKLFGNRFVGRERHADGSSQYGIVLHARGEATRNFGSASDRGESNNAILQNIKIHGLGLNVREFVGYRETDADDIFVTGLFNDAIDIQTLASNIENEDFSERLDELEFESNALIAAHIALAQFGEGLELGNSFTIVRDGDFVQWATNGDPLDGSIACNQDAMRHLNKGLIGLRIENSNNVLVKNVKIFDLNNFSPEGLLICGSYTGPDNGGHILQTESTGYNGADVRAISVFGSRNVIFKDVIISDIKSYNGNAKGFDLIDDAQVKFVSPIIIDDIIAGDCFDAESDDNVNNPPCSCGLFDEGNSYVFGEENVWQFNLEGCIVCPNYWSNY